MPKAVKASFARSPSHLSGGSMRNKSGQCIDKWSSYLRTVIKAIFDLSGRCGTSSASKCGSIKSSVAGRSVNWSDSYPAKEHLANQGTMGRK